MNWVDSAVGGGEDVSVLWAEPPGREFSELYPRQYVVFVGEFFNRAMGDVYEIGTPLPYKLPSTKVRVRDGHLVMENGHQAELGEFVLAPCHVRVVGVPIARDQRTGARVYRVTGPARVSVASPSSCRSLTAS
jgi:hypothetical protein